MQQEMNRQLEELRRKNEEEINALREENQRLRRQLEQNSQQREESHSNGEGEGDTGQDEFRVQTTTNQTGARPRTARRHLFMDGIMEVELPARWKGLTMSQYDGTTDPEEHVDVFTTQAGLYTSDDAILCRVFLTSLKGPTLKWFTRLPPNSIDCFDMLVTRFGIQFATSKPHHLTSLALVNIRQEKGESLREFMERFGKISLNISNLNPEVAMHHLVTALKPGPFVDSLCKKPMSNLNELQTRATKFMQMEELKEFRSTTQLDTREKKYIDRERVLVPRPDSRFKDSRQPKYNRYTPLVSNRARILEEALNADLIATPQRVPTPPNADTTKDCLYHQNYGHTTEDCFTLKDKIEELIQAGQLRRFVKREEGGFSSKEEREGRYEEQPRRTSGY
ncbi:uncharacterized protein LOC114188288 [Vigna unguiculata]|uniref:uncharacterized protein LOC114188288 n=1 Tax=Vigna unguiculata TaxID=3917 RepID=UPI00101601C5|nr:uncharacterized protein LOC114188288 [Vigna unguiculata]